MLILAIKRMNFCYGDHLDISTINKGPPKIPKGVRKRWPAKKEQGGLKP
jgi:hypothetical protein